MRDWFHDNMLFEATGTLVGPTLASALTSPAIDVGNAVGSDPRQMVGDDQAVFDSGIPHVSLSLSRIKDGYLPRDAPFRVPLGNVVLSLWWGSLADDDRYEPAHREQVARLLFKELVLDQRLIDWQLNYYYMAEAVVAYQLGGAPVTVNEAMVERPPRDDELRRGVRVATEFLRLCREAAPAQEAGLFRVSHELASPEIVPKRG